MPDLLVSVVTFDFNLELPAVETPVLSPLKRASPFSMAAVASCSDHGGSQRAHDQTGTTLDVIPSPQLLLLVRTPGGGGDGRGEGEDGELLEETDEHLRQTDGRTDGRANRGAWRGSEAGN